jgi:DNA-directed RNA polymerase subunit RPC12/RpoP
MAYKLATPGHHTLSNAPSGRTIGATSVAVCRQGGCRPASAILQFAQFRIKLFPIEREPCYRTNCSTTKSMKEFEEIGHSGGKITLIFSEPAEVALQISSRGFARWMQIGVSLDGKRLQHWPLQGMNTQPPEPESPMVATFLASDKEGFFGHTCPKCNSYFRTDKTSEFVRCPYCAHRNLKVSFITKNQRLFLDKIRQSYVDAFKSKQNVTIELDNLVDELPANRPEWFYKENRQQNCYKCSICETRFDILGEYAGCPNCGKRNSLQVFLRYAAQVQEEFEKADSGLTDRQDREVEWEKLTRCISDFEAMARDIQSRLVLFPTTPKRRKDIEGLSFQNIIKANQSLLTWFGFEMLFRFSDDDKSFLNRMFNRRHVLTHNGGRADKEYLENTSDTSVALNQKIAVRSNEIRRLVPLLRKVAENLFQGFESIS